MLLLLSLNLNPVRFHLKRTDLNFIYTEHDILLRYVTPGIVTYNRYKSRIKLVNQLNPSINVNYTSDVQNNQ